jgi:glutamyl-tRNA reductase
VALIVAGVSHHTTGLAIRERLAVPAHDLSATVSRLRSVVGAREIVLLSTCNRTEVYAVEGDEDAAPVIWEWMRERIGDDAAISGYVYRDRDAASHLFRVASGLDSMILGEAQIHGQVRDAWEASRGDSSAVLNRLFQTALKISGRVRSETALTRGAASVSSAAVQLARKIFGSLAGRRAMILGAGEMAELALQCLMEEGVRAALVANRTHSRATELASRHGAVALHYDECWARLHEVDVLLCSTASPVPVVRREHIAPALAARGDRPLCVIDIAVPRDVDRAVGALDNVFLYDLDDLREVVATSIERRRAELPSAEQLIASETESFWEWVAGLAAVPVLTDFRDHMDQLRARELAHTLRKLEHLSPEDREAVDHFSRALMNKFLHEPSVRLRAAAANGRGLGIVDALRYLFALGPSTDAANRRKEQ